MVTAKKQRNRLLKKLAELFQLDQPDLDFGFYRIMRTKAQQVRKFIDEDLVQIVEDAFGKIDKERMAEPMMIYDQAIQTAKGYGAPNPEETEPVIKAKAAIDALKDSASAESGAYDHLYRFFDRYYVEGDFISRRYYTRESAGKAAPFAIPYNGEEVKLHWANADQYYTKTTEYFTNYSFDIAQSPEIRKMDSIERKTLSIPDSLKVHFRIVDASEGEHDNVKAAEDKKRFFVLYEQNPVELNDADELVVNFEYKTLPGGNNNVDADTEKTLKDRYGNGLNKGDMPNLAITDTVINAVRPLEKAKAYIDALGLFASTEKIPNRPLLAKYINQYTARNTRDYFIHKDLGGFLKRELDFYLKNEVMHLDEIDKRDVPAVESYLVTLKVIRKIATKLIDFLAQLEDFQKKLWLKRKFVTETNYCITLDRVPEELYKEIAANDAQREEWVRLFAIDEIKGANENLPDMNAPSYSVPLTVAFLKANDKLVLDTAFFSDAFKAKLIESIKDFDEQCDGLLIHSENFQALNLLRERYREQVRCIHIDPPYNTATSGFVYKNSYRHSSWLAMMKNRLSLANHFMNAEASCIQCHIDEHEYENLFILFSNYNLINQGTIIWDKANPLGGSNKLASQHEYVICQTIGNMKLIKKKENAVAMINKAKEITETVLDINSAREKFKAWIKKNKKLDKSEKGFNELDNHGRVYQTMHMGAPEQRINEKYFIPLKHPVTQKYCPIPARGWSNTPEFMQELRKKELIHWGRDESVQPRKISYLDEMLSGELSTMMRSGARGKKETDDLALNFPYCHHSSIYKDLIFSINNKQALVLDFFAGSGTTGHAAISLNRGDNGSRKYILVEMGDYFDTVLKPRIAKVIYSSDWKNGKPTTRNTGISHCFKYLRLESYEDTLNNLVLNENPGLNPMMKMDASLREDYMLYYLLDAETSGSQSLLNIKNFSDPTSYTLLVKRPGSDEQIAKNIDPLETFNYLIGLRVTRLAAPQTFTAKFTRKPDPKVPQDKRTKLAINGEIHASENGKWWFRWVAGWVPADPIHPNNGQNERVLIIWRNLTSKSEEDNLMLDKWFRKYRASAREFEYDTIYVNGTNNLSNLKKDDENWEVRLIEKEFHQKMWESE